MNQPHELERLPILTFALGNDMYALPIDDVLEVAAMVELTPIPDAPPEFLGIVDRHGVILPVVDLRQILQHDPSPVTPATLFIVARRGTDYLGLVVDEVHQVEYVEQTEVHEVSITGKHIRGIINYKGRLIQTISLTSLWATFQADKMAEGKR